MAGLCETVARVTERPAAVVAKGGITSVEIARRAFRATDAFVPGQIIPGVPLWRLGDGSRFPGVPYVVFPGNVGGDDALVDGAAAPGRVSGSGVRTAGDPDPERTERLDGCPVQLREPPRAERSPVIRGFVRLPAASYILTSTPSATGPCDSKRRAQSRREALGRQRCG